MGRNATDETGNRYGRLLVIEQALRPKLVTYPGAWWLCKCDCGNETIIKGAGLRYGNTKSCGCYRKEQSRIACSLPYGEASFNQLYKHYKANAKRRQREWSLSKEYFKDIINRNCYYCGAVPNQVCTTPNNTGDYIYNGIDRLDNDIGYTSDNCVPCCEACNRAKLARSEEEFRDWVIKVYKHFIQGEGIS